MYVLQWNVNGKGTHMSEPCFIRWRFVKTVVYEKHARCVHNVSLLEAVPHRYDHLTGNLASGSTADFIRGSIFL